MSIVLRNQLSFVVAASLATAFSAAQDGPVDPNEFEAFVDGVVLTTMDEKHIPGAVLVVVKDGAIFFSKGYGYADYEKKTPVLPDQTLFQIASVSKLFTATAVMQLHEQGKLKLDEDVNVYLKGFQLPRVYSEPITLLHLMTHRGGFDERAIGMLSRTPEAVVPLGEYLAARMPPQVRPAGEIAAYSNAGVALEGYIVECVSGMPFNEYVTRNIFAPLGMASSSFFLSESMLPDLATGYTYSGKYNAVKPYWLNDGPAGSVVSTGADMAQFMMAHLNLGRHGDARILQEETARLMHSRQYSVDPRIDGIACQFAEQHINGLRTISHGGDLQGYASLLVLVPEKNFGFFVSCNNDVNDLRANLTKQIMNRYYPMSATPEKPAVADDFHERMRRYAGVYRPARFADRSVEKLSILMMQTHVAPGTEDGTLVIAGNEMHTFFEIQPALFQAQDEPNQRALFEARAEGERDRLYFGFWTLERVRWYERTELHALWIGMMVLVFLSAVVLWPLIWLVRRFRNGPVDRSQAARMARVIAWAVSAMGSFMLITLAIILESQNEELAFGMPPDLVALLMLPFVILVSVAAMVILFPAAAGKRGGRAWERIHFAAVAVCSVSLVPFLWFWNLIGLNW